MEPADASTPDIFCPKCDYNVRGLSVNRCPECGTHFDPAELATPPLAWPRRREVGRFLAYWRTVWTATFRGRLLCRQFHHPVSYADAQRFRWLTILHAWFPLFVVSCIDCAERLTPGEAYWIRLLDIGWELVAQQLAIVLVLAVATGVPSYLFHPRRLPIEQQNRGIALSYYACAPLAWTPLLVGLVAGLAYLGGRSMQRVVIGAIVISALAPLATWWCQLVQLNRYATRRDSVAAAWVAIAIPLLWLVAGGITAAGVLLVFQYLGLIVFSLIP